MIKSKSILSLILVLGIAICVMPLISQSQQKQPIKLKIKKPVIIKLLPDLVVDKLVFSGHTVKVYIKNTGLVNAPGPFIKAKITMFSPSGWSDEKNIINRVGKPGAIVPTKTPAYRAHVTFDATGKVFDSLLITKFTILLDSKYKVKEKNEKNNTRVHDGTIK